MKRILLSLTTLGAVAALAVFATGAFFNDTETSTGNLFQAGAIDLLIDSEQHYNGNTCVLVEGVGYQWQGNAAYPEPGSPCDGTWLSKDLEPGVDKFFNFTDLKPGDFGENTISFTVEDNDAWMCADLDVTENSNLGKYLEVVWWIDDGTNTLNDIEDVLYGGPRKLDEWLGLVGIPAGETGPLPLTFADSTMNWITGPATPNTIPVPGDEPFYLGVGWCFGEMELTPGDGRGFTCDGSTEDQNDAQGNRVVADLSFYVEQHRNNPNFVCPERAPEPSPTPEPNRVLSSAMNYSDGGWGGWSCPAGSTAVDGGIHSAPQGFNVIASGLAKSGAPAVDGFNYPTYPHYTYTSPEEGFVLRGGPGTGVVLYVDCVPKP